MNYPRLSTAIRRGIPLVAALLLAACRAAAGTPAPPPGPAATVVVEAGADVPAPALFDVAWDDRSDFRPGLVAAEQRVLEALPGASVYHLDLEIAADLVHLQGRQEVLYTNLEDRPLQEIYFRLFPNLADGATTVSNLTVNGQAVEPAYELRESAMRVPLSPALPPGWQVVLRLDFAVDVPSGGGGNYGTFIFKDDVLALAHFYPMISVYDDEGWNVEIAPESGDVVYADTSFYRVRVTAPAGLTVVASGVPVAEEDAAGERTVTFVAGPMRDFYLAASERYAAVSRSVGETVVHSYTIPELAEGAELALGYAVDALESFNARFGPYPFTEFDLVSTPTLALGVEYPGIVVITQEVYDPSAEVGGIAAPLMMQATVAHEVAHQWWYSVVGNDQLDEPWLDEALAQYATWLYYFDAHGQIAAQGFRRSWDLRWQRVDRADIPIGLPVRAYSGREYGAIVYGRGPLFFEALADVMGDEAFDDFLRDYYQTYQWGIATTEGIRQAAERECACDLAPLFETWVYE